MLASLSLHGYQKWNSARGHAQRLFTVVIYPEETTWDYETDGYEEALDRTM
jgi:hypothetical protein